MHAEPASAAPPAIAVAAAVVTGESVTENIDAVGSLLADESVIIRPEIAGRIDALHFREGEPVRAGSPLVDLNPDEQRAAVAQMEAQVELEAQSVARVREMWSRKLIAKQQYDEALARFKNAEAQRERDKVRLGRMRITAPFAGVLGLKQVSVGDYVEAGQALVNLEAIDSVKLDFNVPEKYAGRISAGLPLSCQVDAWPEQAFDGKVYAVDPQIDPASRTLRLRARLSNPKHALKPGMFARVTLNLGDARTALMLPEQAIFYKGSRAMVFRVGADQHVKVTEVELGMRKPGFVEVAKGLGQGDRVVTDGQQKLRDGMTVNVIEPVVR